MSKTLLLVEDDPFLSSLLKNRLQKEGFEVILATDGEQALDLLKISNVNLILLDIILPKKTGFEVLEEIQNNPELRVKELPVIIISNLGQPQDIERGKKLGVIEYFIKAKISIDDLVNRIKDFVNK
ncbi:MAG: response regulator [Patescibacteria group bacterium]